MINKYTNKQRGLLAVIMAMVMVFAGAAFVAAEVDATEGGTTTPEAVTEANGVAYIVSGEVKKYYTSLVDAINSVGTTATTIELIKSATIPSAGITIELGVDLTINANDKTITMDGNIDLKGSKKLTINNAKFLMAANSGNSGQAIKNCGSGTLTINGCSFTDKIVGQVGSYAIQSYEGSTGVISIIDTDMGNKKISMTSGSSKLNLQNAKNVYLKFDVNNSFKTGQSGNVSFDADTTFTTLVIKAELTMNGNYVKADSILVKTNGKVIGGELSGTFDVYDKIDDGNSNATANIVFDKTKLIGINTINSGVTIQGEINLANNAYMQFVKDAVLSATVTATDGTKATFANVVAGEGGFTLRQGSLVAAGATTGGTINVTDGTFKVDSSNVNSTFTVSGGKFIVPEDIEMQKEITVSGGTVMLYSNANVVYNGGTVAVAPGVIATKTGGTGDLKTVSTTSLEEAFGMSKDLEYDYVVKTKAFLAGNLTIPEGITLTIDGELDLCGYDLIVYGNLVVGKKGIIESTLTGGSIVLGITGEVQNDGTIGYKTSVIVSDQKSNGAAGTVEMKGVSGIGFSLTKEIKEGLAEPVYTLTINGEATKKNDAYKLVLNNIYISDLIIKDLNNDTTPVTIQKSIIIKDGSLIIDSKANVAIVGGAQVSDYGLTLKNNASMTIDGKVTGTAVWLYNGTTVTINGNANSVLFKAMTGEYPTFTGDSKNNLDTVNDNAPSEGWNVKWTGMKLNNLCGVCVDISSKVYSKYVSESNPEVSYTEQMMNITGVATFVDKAVGIDSVPAPSGKMVVANTAYVPIGAELILDDGMTVTGGTIVTEGLMKIVEGTYSTYKGASYTTEVPGETSGTIDIAYYTNFDDAYANIETADDMTITLRGGYEFTKTYVIAAEQSVEIASGDAGIYTISKDGKITVEEDGSLFNGFATSPSAGIKGMLIVMNGGDCKPVKDSYEVSSKDADGNMTYTSAELAIENSKEGDTIQITGAVTFEDPTTIPAGVTVEVANGASITAKDDLVVEGKLINKGSITVGTSTDVANLKVSGEIDTIEGTVAVSGDATVTGKVAGAMTAKTVNAAGYTDGTDDVYTSVSSAVEAVSKMDILVPVTVTGKVSESSDVVLAEGQKLIIDGEAVLKSVRLDVGSNLTVNGKLTADVIAATGVMDTTGALADSVVSVKEIEDVEFDVKKNDAKNTVTMYMDVIASGNMKGTTTVTAGSVQLDAALTVSKTNVMKVSEGATLVVMKNITAESGYSKYFSNAGTMIINDNNVILKGLNLGGTVDVVEKKALTVSNVTVSGTLTTGEDASVTVADGKYMYVGSKPTTLGAAGTVNADVAFGTDAYIVVFEGSAFTNTDADVKMDSTAYTINDIAFATVYVAEGNNNVLVKIVDPIVLKLEDLKVDFTDTDNDGTWDDTEGYTIDWKSGSTGANTVPVGQYDNVNAKIGYASINVTISVGPGMLVYIDDLKVGTEKPLTIGTHTITVYIEKGYEGTPAITLNGVAVTDGKLVITTDMMDLEQNLLSVTGATVMQDQPVVIQPSDSEKDGMELTDILLIVLVVLIVIMAIIVALRMMRS